MRRRSRTHPRGPRNTRAAPTTHAPPVVLIAMLAGVTDAVGLIALFGVNTAMILFGLIMERANAGRASIDWRPFIYGCIAGAGPWVAIGVQLGVSQANSRGVPGFVFAIFLTLFVLFNTFAINMWLQYRGRGRWADPEFAERVYLILSLVAKSALAWQVYLARSPEAELEQGGQCAASVASGCRGPGPIMNGGKRAAQLATERGDAAGVSVPSERSSTGASAPQRPRFSSASPTSTDCSTDAGPHLRLRIATEEYTGIAPPMLEDCPDLDL
ncbi:MAG: heliorhodopsin HeR [Solirubrobacteraceae bacterium]